MGPGNEMNETIDFPIDLVQLFPGASSFQRPLPGEVHRKGKLLGRRPRRALGKADGDLKTLFAISSSRKGSASSK